MSSICENQVIFWCEKSHWWPICVAPYAVFWTAAGKSLAGVQLIQAKIYGIYSHNTLSVAAEPFHVLYMDPMSDVSMCNQLLVAHHCLPMPCFGLQLGKVLQIHTTQVALPLYLRLSSMYGRYRSNQLL
jgi:hypothetical protein